MLHGSIWNKLPLFAFPVAATAILEQLFNASDIAVVGNFTGTGKTVAVAAVGANSAIIALIVNLFVGIALGANVVIANAIGRDDREAVKKAVHTSIVVAFLGGILVTAVGELVAAPLLDSFHVPDAVFALALLYLRIYLLGMPVILLYNFEAAIFRSVGDTHVPGNLRRAECCPKSVFCSCSAYDSQRGRNCHGDFQYGQLCAAAPVPAGFQAVYPCRMAVAVD